MRMRKYSAVTAATFSGGAISRSEMASRPSCKANSSNPKNTARAEERTTVTTWSGKSSRPLACATRPVVPMRRKPKAHKR